jgi:PAS domain S-box-containing protein
MPKKNTKDGSKASADEFMKYHNAVFSLVKCLPQNFTEALHLITETSSKMLEVKRVGVWFFDDKRSFITCLDQFTAGDNSQHTFGSILNAKKYPIYFRSLGENRIIATSTAKDDPRTSEFADSYLTPFGITSMLDIPIWKGNSVIGVVCCEHIGKPRLWSEKEKVFAAFISDIISMSFSADMCSIAEERLLNEKRWRENIIDLAPNIIVGLEQKSNIVIFNRCAEELTGYKAEEVRGKPWIEIFIPEKGREELYKVWDNLVMEDDTFQEVHENEIVTKEGTKRLIRWHNRSLSGKSGKPLVLSIGEDITEQREIFESLKQSESKYKNVMESANEAIMLVDVSQKLIKETNAASENLLGIKTSEIVGKKFGDFMSQKNLMMITYPAKKNGSQSHGTSWIDEAIANDGRKIPVQITGSIIKTEGLEYYLLIIRNITSFIDTKKILEDDKSKLEKTVELKNDALKNTLRQVEASRRLTDIGALSATVAHEIRNPLSVIRAAVYNIRRKISEPGIEKHLDNIEKKILQTDKIITNLGSYAR